jgi:hypothetical protein
MRAAALAAGFVLAVCLTVPAVSGPNSPDIKARTATTSPKKRAVQPLKQPSWEECYAMSRQRGFDHDIDEWFQSIADCQEGKIPL